MEDERGSFDSVAPNVRHRRADAQAMSSEYHQPVQDDRASITDSVEPRPRVTRLAAQRNLEWWDVAALIINKMVGTGIFTGPYMTMQLTRNKSLTITFWVVGFVYTLFSMWLYLEFARDLPYTGGEMVYLDHMFPRPRLLVYTWYAFYFVVLYTTCTNSMQFGRYVLLAADVEATPDRRLVAVVITTFVCLLLYFDSLTSRYANALTALAKVALMIAVFGAGCAYLSTHGAHTTSWDFTYEKQAIPGAPSSSWSQGLLLVFFSYHGWENATFVAGEIPKYKVLRNGFIAAVVTVGALYIMIVAVFCSALPSDTLDDSGGFNNYMALVRSNLTAQSHITDGAKFFSNANEATPRARQASAILISLSAAGSMISVAYTAVRVKQIIGWTNVLPLSKLWRRTDLGRHIAALLPNAGHDQWQIAVNQAVAVRKGTPEGGIILHYIVSVIFICLTQAFKSLDGAIRTSGNVLIYGHFFYEALIGFGYAAFYKPATRATREVPASEWNAPEPFRWFVKRRQGLLLLGSLTLAMSMFVVATELRRSDGRIYFYANIVPAAASALYWLVFVWAKSGSRSFNVPGITLIAQVHGKDDENDARRQCSLCARFAEPTAHRHREDGYLEFNRIRFTNTWVGRAVGKVAAWFDRTDEHEPESPGSEQDEVSLRRLPKRDARVSVEDHARANTGSVSTLARD